MPATSWRATQRVKRLIRGHGPLLRDRSDSDARHGDDKTKKNRNYSVFKNSTRITRITRIGLINTDKRCFFIYSPDTKNRQ
jgi:hypothetical protein